MEIQTGVLKPGTKILLMDDLLATGGKLFHY
jgi:adenine/guanine phosphoribosyltransferase-like PRPP-binding protein